MALFDITEMMRQQGSKRRIVVLAPINVTSAIASQLATIHRRILEPWTRSTSRIIALYDRELKRRLTQDNASELDILFGELGEEVNRLIIELTPSMLEWALKTEQWHRTKWASNLLAGTEIQISQVIGPAGAQESVEDFMRRNTALIRNVTDQTRAKVSELVFRGLQERAGSRKVAKEVSRQLGISRRRAIRIAADQANKLGGALDRQRSREAGFEFWKWRHSGKKHPRLDHKARDGKIYTDENAPADLPGQLPFCGCVRQATAILDEAEAARIRARKRGGEFGPTAVPDPPPPAPDPEPVAAPEPEIAPAPRTGFRSPINPAVTASSIVVRKRLQASKDLAPGLAEAQRTEPLYQLPVEFRARKLEDFGKAQLGAGFTDEAASMIAALKPELDALSDQLGIPRLRGFKTLAGKRANADMGDGVMGVNPSAFNEYAAAAGIGGRTVTARVAELERIWLDLDAQVTARRAELVALRAQAEAAFEAGDIEQQAIIRAQRYRLSEETGKLDKKASKAYSAWRQASKASERPVAVWKPGDAPAARPWTVKYYFEDGIDQARALLFHEFGHHVHQYLAKEGSRRQFGKPPLEIGLPVFKGRATMGRMLSEYGTTNGFEWFAENFSAFVMGRRDLIEPEALDLIERIFNGRYP
jgi:hypothetical protein